MDRSKLKDSNDKFGKPPMESCIAKKKGESMNKKEHIQTEKDMKIKKKYASPTVKGIGEVRDITKGSTIGNTDSGGQNSNVSSDPHYQ